MPDADIHTTAVALSPRSEVTIALILRFSVAPMIFLAILHRT